MPLSMTKAGETSVIFKIGGKEETRQFLHKLGFIVGDHEDIKRDSMRGKG